MTKGSSSRLRDASEPPRTNILAELCLPGTYSPCMATATATWDINDVTKNRWRKKVCVSIQQGSLRLQVVPQSFLSLLLNLDLILLFTCTYIIIYLYPPVILWNSFITPTLGRKIMASVLIFATLTYQISWLWVNEYRFRNCSRFGIHLWKYQNWHHLSA